jgi:hypothetical protein
LKHKERGGQKKKINYETEKSGGEQIMFYEEKFIHAIQLSSETNISIEAGFLAFICNNCKLDNV